MNFTKIFYTFSTLLIFLILFLYFFHQIPLDITNSDLGRHLLLGKIIVTTGNVPKINLLSYSNTDFPFINSHWLSEVIFYAWYSVFGFNGLIILSVLIMTGAFASLFSFAAKRINLYTTLLISIVYLQVLAERTEVRPELFSFLLLSLFIIILYKYRERYTKWIYLLIPLELLWVNFHIYFFVGIAVLFIFLFDSYIIKKDAINSKKFRTLLFVMLASGVVTLCNPNFIAGAVFPLFVLNNYGITVEENMNFFSVIQTSSDATLYLFLISVILLWITLLISIKKMQLVDILLALFFTILGFFAIRDLPLFVFGTFVPFVKAITFILHDLSQKIGDGKTVWYKNIVFIIVCLCLIPTFSWIMSNHIFGFGVIDNANNAVNFLLKNNIRGNIYNNFDIGNYLEYRLYPRDKVFVDNRPEAYPKDFFQNVYFPMRESEGKFDQVSNKYNFTVIFYNYTELNPDSTQFEQQLVNNKNLKMVFLDNEIVIFLKNTPANQSVINAHLITQNNIKLSNAELKDKNKLLQLSNFFKNIKWYKPLLITTLQYLQFNPTNCAALENVAYLLNQKHDPNYQIYYTKYLQTCSTGTM